MLRSKWLRCVGPTRATSNGPSADHLAVHLLRHVLAPRRPGRGRDGTLLRAKLRAVVEHIEAHFDASPSLE
jgi:hypothetical protein